MYSLNEVNFNSCIEEATGQQNAAFILALHNAIKNNELSVVYQPRYNINSGESTLFEALVRWPKKGIGTLYPAAFIDEAIKYGLIYELDLFVFKQCCRDLIQLRENINKKIKIAINITPMECESLHHTQKILYICESNGLKLSDFEFEITESTHINDHNKIKIFCDTVSKHGATISLDDFGTKFSPLTSLCELPISFIKIDRSFTNKVVLRDRSHILIKHLIKLAHEMKIKVVAEGVEHSYQRDLLINMGCDQLQGFLMCKPLRPQIITTTHISM